MPILKIFCCIFPNLKLSHDGQIQVSEAHAVKLISFHSNLFDVTNFADVTGIEYFTNITYLECSGCSNNVLTSLDLRGSTGLSTI